ncbi:MAG: reverse transcriptase family protein, partial [Candidatus Thiodiazotropha sp.]
MVDTGSSSTLLSCKVVREIFGNKQEVQPLDTSSNLTSVDGSPLDIKGKLDIPFTIGDCMFQHEFLVANIDLPGILGLDFLEQYDISIKVASASLQMGDKMLQLEREDSEKCARVKLSSRIVVPPNSEVAVKAYVNDQSTVESDCLFEPYKVLGTKGLLVSNSLVKPKNVVLSLVNVTKKPIQVKQHTLVGSLSSIQNVDQLKSEESLSKAKSYAQLPEHLQTLLNGASEKLKKEQREALRSLLVEFQDIFMGPDGKLGRTDLVKHTIDTGQAKPIKIPPRRVPQKQKETIEKEINSMLENDIIEPSTSPWSSPVLLVTKKNGSIRFCIDYRRLNAVTIKDAYPLPRIDDSLDSLSGARWFTTLDLVSGYWQAEILETDRPKTAFSCHKGLYQFKVLPFGLSNAPAVFERLMELVLRGLTWEKCLCYLDDVIVFGKTFEEALQNHKIIFERFRAAN